jgi:hypothetical protein
MFLVKIITPIIIFFILFSPIDTYASLYYGEPPVLGEKDEEFVPRKPGLADNPLLIGGMFFTTAVVFYVWSKRSVKIADKQ